MTSTNIIDELTWRGLINQSTDLDNLREAAPDLLARLVAVVPQKPYLFSGTVASNLR